MISCPLPIRMLAPCSQEQWKLFFGQVSPQLSFAWLNGNVTHLPNHMHHHTLFRSHTQYLVAVDRYLNWPIIERVYEGSYGLIDCPRRLFATFGIPDELASDGRPEFVTTATSTFLRNWGGRGVSHCLFSVAFPHLKCRAEKGVKTTKRTITSNAGPHSNLDTDALQRAMLQYCNTPDPPKL